MFLFENIRKFDLEHYAFYVQRNTKFCETFIQNFIFQYNNMPDVSENMLFIYYMH